MTEDKLRKKQSEFCEKIGRLIKFAYENGYELTFGDVYRDPRCGYGHPKSLHRKRLAADFNLFRDGVFLTETEDHRRTGEFWESIGGTWGGRFGDGNHYSLEYNGMR